MRSHLLVLFPEQPVSFWESAYDDNVCVCVCTYVIMWAHICLYMWRLEVDIRCLPQLIFILFFEAGSVSEPVACDWAGWAGQRAIEIHWPPPSRLGLQAWVSTPCFVWEDRWSKLRSSHLHGRHFSNRVIFPTPRPMSSCVFPALSSMSFWVVHEAFQTTWRLKCQGSVPFQKLSSY